VLATLLTCTEDDLLDAGWVLTGWPALQDHPLELGLRQQVVKARLALRMPG